MRIWILMFSALLLFGCRHAPLSQANGIGRKEAERAAWVEAERQGLKVLKTRKAKPNGRGWTVVVIEKESEEYRRMRERFGKDFMSPPNPPGKWAIEVDEKGEVVEVRPAK